MKVSHFAPVLVVVALLIISSSSAQAGLFSLGGHASCGCEPSCGAAHDDCCEPACDDGCDSN